MPDQQLERPVVCLDEFISRVRKFREEYWKDSLKNKEMWFRGESRDYGDTILHPELYRPTTPGAPLKPIDELLDIESELLEEFKRNAVVLSDATSDDSSDWDSYFLMQHHNCPTRLLDWSDGALVALHFAVRNKSDDTHDARVYVLHPYRLSERLKELPDAKQREKDWKAYVDRYPSYGLHEDEDEDSYLPSDKEDRKELNVPRPPLALDFPLFTRRIAAQRSRFIVFGTAPTWLLEEYKNTSTGTKQGTTHSTIQVIAIKADYRPRIRQELRDCGVTESVIYPDLDGLGREIRQIWEDRRAEENV